MSTPPPLHVPGTPPSGKKTKILLITLLVSLVVLAGISVVAVLASVAVPVFRKVQEKGNAIKAEREAAAAAPLPPLVITDELRQQLDELGRQIASEIKLRDADALGKRHDIEAVVARTFRGLPATKDFRDARRGFQGALQGRKGGILSNFVGQEIIFLETRQRDGLASLLMRCTPAGGGISYVEIILAPEGSTHKIVDLYTMIFGQMVSEEARMTLVSMLSGEDRGVLATLVGLPAVDTASIDALNEMSKLLREGKPAELIPVYESLPEKTRKIRGYFTLYLSALSMVRDQPEMEDRYRGALEKAASILGEGATTDLLLIDKYFMDGDYEKAVRSVENVKAIVGDDPPLTVLQGNIKLMQGDLEAAERLVIQAEEQEPELLTLLDLKLLLHSRQNAHEAFLQDLRDLKKKHGLLLGAVELEGPKYEAFRAAPQYQVWLQEIGQ